MWRGWRSKPKNIRQVEDGALANCRGDEHRKQTPSLLIETWKKEKKNVGVEY